MKDFFDGLGEAYYGVIKDTWESCSDESIVARVAMEIAILTGFTVAVLLLSIFLLPYFFFESLFKRAFGKLLKTN